MHMAVSVSVRLDAPQSQGIELKGLLNIESTVTDDVLTLYK